MNIYFDFSFIHYLFNSPIALNVSKFLRKYTEVPDEAIFSTLNYNSEAGAPGGYLGTTQLHTFYLRKLIVAHT